MHYNLCQTLYSVCIHHLNLLCFLRCGEMLGLINNCNGGLHDFCPLLFKQGHVTPVPLLGSISGLLPQVANRVLLPGILAAAPRAWRLPLPAAPPQSSAGTAGCCRPRSSARGQLPPVPWLHHSLWRSSDALVVFLALLAPRTTLWSLLGHWQLLRLPWHRQILSPIVVCCSTK